jgi:predicted MFS family arabinose efflux permease
LSLQVDKRLLCGLLAALCIGNFAIFAGPLYIGGLMDGYGFDEATAGLISTLEIGATALVCIFLPNRVALVALRQAGIIGAAIVLLANLLTLGAESFAHLAAVRVLAGAAAGVTLSVASTVVARVAEPDRMIAIALAINTIIMALVLAVMGYAKQQWLFDGFAYTFAATVALLLPLLWFLPDTAIEAGRVPTPLNPAATSVWLSLGLLGVILIFTFCVIEGSVYAFSERSGLRLGLVESKIGMLLAGAQICGLFGAAIPALLGDRVARLPMILIGTAVITLAGILIYRYESTELYIFAMLSFSFGFFLAFPYLLGNCARLDKSGVWGSRATGANLLGGGLAPVGAGAVVIASSYESLATVILMLGLITTVLALVFSQLFKRQDRAATLALTRSNGGIAHQ